MSEYRPFYADTVVVLFGRLPKRQRRRFLDQVYELSEDPFLEPDEKSSDDEGRELCHVSVDGFLVTYWVDHAVKLVMIVEVELSD